ncbi:hypothetical protein Tco_0121602 [Tanacetum coccineum]
MIVVVMSCGLFCMHGLDIKSGRGTIVVWNPSIRKSGCILVPDHVPHSTIDFDNFGFGVCPVTCDPTIIKISYPAQSITWQVEIFTLSSKRWNAIIPSSNLPRKSIKLDLQTQLKESLVVSANINIAMEKVYGVWMMVMEDDGNVASFKKLFNIDTFNTSVGKILGFMKRGEPVIESQDSDLSVLEVYEPWSEHLTNLGIYGVDGSFFMDSYGETLLLLDHSNGFVYSDTM